MKTVFETAECEAVRNSIFCELRWQKAREPSERLCHGTESKWLADECVDLVGLWYCKSLARYGRWLVCNAL